MQNFGMGDMGMGDLAGQGVPGGDSDDEEEEEEE